MSEAGSNNEEVGAAASDAVSEDEEGVDPGDIQVVMTQVGHSRRDVIDALRRNNNDTVDAVMYLVNNIP